MKMKKRQYKLRAGLLAVLLTVMSAVSCGETAHYEIAVIVKSTTSDFWRGVSDGVNAAAVGFNAEVSFDGPSAEEDYTAQNELIIAAAARGVDAIVLSAINPAKSKDAVDAAAAAGVKIIEIDSGTASDRVSCFIGTDNYEAGELAGKAVLDAVSSTNIVVGIVSCGVGSENLTIRCDGLVKYIEENGGRVAGISNSSSDAESAKKAAGELLAANKDINVLVGLNEWATLGAGYSIRESGLSDSVACIGFDSNRSALGMLETGEIDALVVQNPFAIGYLGVESAVNLLRGEPVGDMTTSLTVITRENMFEPENQRKVFRLN